MVYATDQPVSFMFNESTGVSQFWIPKKIEAEL